MAKAILVKGKEKRVESGHPWIFESDIEKVEGSFVPGDIVDVCSSRNRFLCRGYYNPKSQIAIRIMTYEREEIDYGFFYKRIQRLRLGIPQKGRRPSKLQGGIFRI